MLTRQRADNIRWYLTGADSDGGIQTDPDSSLGKYRSSRRVNSLGVELISSIRGITINHVSANCGPGIAVLAATESDWLTFTAPDGLAGDEVRLANGEMRVITDGEDADKHIIITRSTEDNLQGSATLNLVARINNIFDNVNYVESKTGDIEYRCLALRTGDTPAGNVKVWLASACAGYLAIGKQGPTSQPNGLFTDKTGTGEGSAPAGVTFVSPTAIDHADVVVIGGLFAGEIYGLWIKRTIAAASSGDPRVDIQINYQSEVFSP